MILKLVARYMAISYIYIFHHLLIDQKHLKHPYSYMVPVARYIVASYIYCVDESLEHEHGQ